MLEKYLNYGKYIYEKRKLPYFIFNKGFIKYIVLIRINKECRDVNIFILKIPTH